jgi:hypothetical protein
MFKTKHVSSLLRIAVLCIRIRISVSFWALRIRHYKYWSESSIIKQKSQKNGVDFYCLWLLYDFLSLDADIYVPSKIMKASPPNLLQQNRWTDGGNIKIAHRYMNMEIGNEAAQFHFWEYKNRILFASAKVMRTFGASTWIWHECHFPHTNSA